MQLKNIKDFRKKSLPCVMLVFTMFACINSVYAENNTESYTDSKEFFTEDVNEFSVNQEYDYSSNDKYDIEKKDSIDTDGFFTDEINVKDTSKIYVENTDTISFVEEGSRLYDSIHSIEKLEKSYISPNNNLRKVILQRAFSQIGLPYIWGSSNPWSSFDCSGLSTYAYKGAGIMLPRTSYNQALVGLTVPLSEAKAGDLLFFGKGGVSHVGIYTGNNTMVHASPNKGVCYVNLSEYNMSNFKWAKNIIDF